MKGPRLRNYGIAVAVALGFALLYYFGRPVWGPIKARLLGERTVRQVLQELQPRMSERFSGVVELTDGGPMSILAFKEERRLELWKKKGRGWTFVQSYPFTGYSGALGPKLREGDRQIPEGEYRIEYLNPNSSYHLSMKVDYPNAFDREMGVKDGRDRLGFDIFIHGSSVTIGCIPIGDDGIEELFYLVGENGIENVTVVICPRDFRTGKAPPAIAEIEWEDELYMRLAERLQSYPSP